CKIALQNITELGKEQLYPLKELIFSSFSFLVYSSGSDTLNSFIQIRRNIQSLNYKSKRENSQKDQTACIQDVRGSRPDEKLISPRFVIPILINNTTYDRMFLLQCEQISKMHLISIANLNSFLRVITVIVTLFLNKVKPIKAI
ncbi:MAG: hypothetical protein L0G05_00305, partial [Chryseobacterium sp.]|nr:hypothetical protein [Chryseobacterium sp.]